MPLSNFSPMLLVALNLNIFPAFYGELLACVIEQVYGLLQPLLCTYIALSFVRSLVPTIFMQSFLRQKLNYKFRRSEVYFVFAFSRFNIRWSPQAFTFFSIFLVLFGGVVCCYCFFVFFTLWPNDLPWMILQASFR